jgi:hypothetical protein
MFEDSLGYIVRVCLKKTNKNTIKTAKGKPKTGEDTLHTHASAKNLSLQYVKSLYKTIT